MSRGEKEPRKAKLDERPDTNHAPPLALYAVYPQTRNLAAKVRLCIDLLVKRLES
jgi:DNA-binding transcriptional LysR family regulator